MVSFANTLNSTGSPILPIIIIVLYFVMLISIAYYFKRKEGSLNDFLLAGRGLNGWMSAFAYGTTYFSAVIFIGYAGRFGWNFGLSSVWIGLSNAIIGTLFAWIVLAKRTRNLTRNLNARTLPEYFEKRYQSKKLRLVASIIIFIFLIPYSTSVYQGLAYLFEGMFGIDFIWCVIIMAVVTAIYLFFGGYMATSVTDFVQGIIMIAGVIIMVLTLLGKVNWGEGLRALTENGLGLAPSTQSASGRIIDTPMFNIIILCLLTSFGIWGLPQSIHKFYAVRDLDAIKRGSVVSTVFSFIIGCGAYLVGSFVTLLVSKDSVPLTSNGALNFDAVVPIMLTENLPNALMGVIMVLVLSASMSTLAALALTSASSISMDLYKEYINPSAEDKKVKTVLRVLCLVYVAISALLSIFNLQAIVTFMSLSWGTLAGCFIGPYIWGLYSKKVTKWGAWSSIISGLVITFVMIICMGVADTPDSSSLGKILIAGIGRSPFIGVIAMAASMVVTPVVSLFTKAPDASVTDMVGKEAK